MLKRLFSNLRQTGFRSDPPGRERRTSACKPMLLLASCLLLPAICGGGRLCAQEVYHSDTLFLKVTFPVGGSEVRLDWDGNGDRLLELRAALQPALDAGAFMERIFVTTSSSPDGSTTVNVRLAKERGDAIRDFMCNELGISPFNVHVNSAGEDWDALRVAVERLDIASFPWKWQVISIIDKDPVWKFGRDSVEDSRKAALRSLDGGKAWDVLKRDVFPGLRSACGDVAIVVHRIEPVKAPVRNEIVLASGVTLKDGAGSELAVPADTVAAPVDIIPAEPVKKDLRLAIRTNAAFVPFGNVGVEVPIGKRWSVAADLYYPWIWRDGVHMTCNELMAFGAEGRFWFPPSDLEEGRSLLGHSIGLYGVAGYYDFERNYAGYQGEYMNFGIDYQYALSIFKGHVHLEFGIGLGFIMAVSRPYNVYEEGGPGYVQAGVRRYDTWYGPTRLSINVVVPLYFKSKKKVVPESEPLVLNDMGGTE